MTVRELGKIKSADFSDPDGRNAFCIFVDFKGSAQGWQLCAGPDLERVRGEILEFFKVKTPEDMKGIECYALRCFDDWGAMIEGLETLDGRRLTRRMLFPDTPTMLESEIETLKGRIRQSQSQIRDWTRRLRDVGDRYTDWDG